MTTIFVVCLLACSLMTGVLGYIAGSGASRPCTCPDCPRSSEVDSDEEVDRNVRDATPRDDDLEWLRDWSGPSGSE